MNAASRPNAECRNCAIVFGLAPEAIRAVKAGRTSGVRVAHLVSNQIVDFGAVVFVGRQALVHLGALHVGKTAADVIHAGAIHDETHDVVYTDARSLNARVPPTCAR